MSDRGRSEHVAFLAAYLAGLAAGWAGLAAIVMAVFKGPDTELPLALLAAVPVAGIAAFQLVYTLITGRRLTVRFWGGAIALVLVGILLAYAAQVALPGQTLVAFAVFVTVTAGTGMQLLAATKRPDGGRQ